MFSTKRKIIKLQNDLGKQSIWSSTSEAPRVVAKLCHCKSNRDLVRELTQLDCCHSQIQVLQKGWAEALRMRVTTWSSRSDTCRELLYGMDNSQVESSRIRLGKEASKGNTVVGVSHRPPDHCREADKPSLDRMPLFPSGYQGPSWYLAGRATQWDASSPGTSQR